MFVPADPTRKGQIVLDVPTQELFDDPARVLQRFDAACCEKVQHFDCQKGLPIQWWTVVASGVQPNNICGQIVVNVPINQNGKLYGR